MAEGDEVTEAAVVVGGVGIFVELEVVKREVAVGVIAKVEGVVNLVAAVGVNLVVVVAVKLVVWGGADDWFGGGGGDCHGGGGRGGLFPVQQRAGKAVLFTTVAVHCALVLLPNASVIM